MKLPLTQEQTFIFIDWPINDRKVKAATVNSYLSGLRHDSHDKPSSEREAEHGHERSNKEVAVRQAASNTDNKATVENEHYGKSRTASIL